MWRDDTYLLDMLIAARKAAMFVEGLTFGRFVASDLHNYAIFSVLEVVGEAVW